MRDANAQGICATGFKGTEGNAHCAKFESNTNRMNFEYAPGNLKSKSQNTFLSQRNKNKSGLGDFSLLKCVAIDLVSNA